MKNEAFYDKNYSVGFWKKLKLWFDSFRFALSSIGGVGKVVTVAEKQPVMVEKNNDKKKTAQIVILPQATSIKGDLVTDGDVKFHGRLQGNIVASGAFVIGRGGVIRGNVQAQVCAIGGKVIGNVNCLGPVEIMDSGYLRGDIESAESVMVKGKVRGNIHADKRVSLMNTANVVGDLDAPKIRIDAGADFKGRINCDNSVTIPQD
ncbi:polymer-forming cytoskeletal protein [candidate division KSB1 bacterium]